VPAATPEECAATGECTDWDLQSWAPQCYPGTDPACMSACLLPFDTSSGWPRCTAVWTRRGCLAYGACDGPRLERAHDAVACAAHGSGCREPGFWELTPKNEAECVACGGTPEPYFEWQPGRWELQPQPTMQARALVPVNRWGPALNRTKLAAAGARAAAAVLAERIRSALQCKDALLADVMRVLVCDCEGGTDCYAVDETAIGRQAIFAGVAADMEWASAAVHVPANALATARAEVSATAIADLALRLPLGAHRRRTLFDPYEVVVGGGRLLGQGVTLTLPPLAAPVELCLLLDPNIPLDPLGRYPVPDFGTFNGLLWDPLQLTVTVVGDSAQYCALVAASGNYYPIRRAGPAADLGLVLGLSLGLPAAALLICCLAPMGGRKRRE
jgi:hypothetical protein